MRRKLSLLFDREHRRHVSICFRDRRDQWLRSSCVTTLVACPSEAMVSDLPAEEVDVEAQQSCEAERPSALWITFEESDDLPTITLIELAGSSKSARRSGDEANCRQKRDHCGNSHTDVEFSRLR